MNRIVRARLAAQQIAKHDFKTPRALVSWMGALQAQDYLACKWAVGLRLPAATDGAVERAISDGAVLRTHAMRGTWQLVAPADIRWIVELVGPRVIDRAKTRHRALGLDAKTFRKSSAALVRALRGGRHLDRAELTDVLETAGVSTKAERLSHILAVAELEGAICSGVRRGKQSTHALLEERAPDAKSLHRREAIHELANRYAQSRAPASASDFQWWSGLPAAEARDEFESHASPKIKTGAAHLLPAFDEWLIGYRDRSAFVDSAIAKQLPERSGMLNPVIVLDGRVIGTWSRTFQRKSVVVSHQLYVRVSAAERRAIEAATKRYLAFLGE